MGHFGDYSNYPNLRFITVALNYGAQAYTAGLGITATQTGGIADSTDFMDNFSSVTYDVNITPGNIGGLEGADGFETVFSQTYLIFSF